MDAFKRFPKPFLFNRNTNAKPTFNFRSQPEVSVSNICIDPHAMDVDVEMNKIEGEQLETPNAKTVGVAYQSTNAVSCGQRRMRDDSTDDCGWSDDSNQNGPIHVNLLTPKEEKSARCNAAKSLTSSLNVSIDEITTPLQNENPASKSTQFPGKFAFAFSNFFHKSSKGDLPTYVPSITKGIFGSKLQEIVEAAWVEWGPMKAKIPKICVQVANYLLDHCAFEKEGIFRLGGAFHRLQSIVAGVVDGVYDGGFNSLDGKFIEDGGCVSSVPSIPNMEAPVHEMACVLKKFLRDLAEPIIPNRLHAAGQAIVNLYENRPNKAISVPSVEVIKHVQDIILLLPLYSRDILQFTLDIATFVASKQQHNFMTPENLGRVIGPNLIRCNPVIPIRGCTTGTTGLDSFDWVNKFFEICVLANAECVPGMNQGMYPSATSPLFCLSEKTRMDIRQASMADTRISKQTTREPNRTLLPRAATQVPVVGFSIPTSTPKAKRFPPPNLSSTGFFFPPDSSRTLTRVLQEDRQNKKSRLF